MSGPALLPPGVPSAEGLGRLSLLLSRQPSRSASEHPVPSQERTRHAVSRQVLEALDGILAGGEVEPHPLPGGIGEEVRVEVAGHVVLLHPRRPGIRVVSRGVDRAQRWCTRLSGLGAVLLMAAWLMVGLSILGAESLRLGTLVGAAAVVLFLFPLGISLPLSRRMVELRPDQEAARRVEAGLRRALALEDVRMECR